MSKLTRKKILQSLLAPIMIILMGAAPPSGFITLDGSFHGRKSLNFFSSAQNIDFVLPSGTKAKILEAIELTSGNYGLKIEIIDGEFAGRGRDKSLFLYYNKNNPAATPMRLFKDLASMNAGQETEQPKEAQAAETKAATPVYSEPASASSDKPKSESHTEASPAVCNQNCNPKLEKLPTPSVTANGLSAPIRRNNSKNCFEINDGGHFNVWRHSTNRRHKGVDFIAPVKTPIHTMADGKVITVQANNPTAGNFISICHKINGKTLVSRYMHLGKMAVRPGQIVTSGAFIAQLGRTAIKRKTSTHLHFEIRDYGTKSCEYAAQHASRHDIIRTQALNPLQFLGTMVKERGELTCLE